MILHEAQVRVDASAETPDKRPNVWRGANVKAEKSASAAKVYIRQNVVFGQFTKDHIRQEELKGQIQ